MLNNFIRMISILIDIDSNKDKNNNNSLDDVIIPRIILYYNFYEYTRLPLEFDHEVAQRTHAFMEIKNVS